MTANFPGYKYCGNSWWTRADLARPDQIVSTTAAPARKRHRDANGDAARAAAAAARPPLELDDDETPLSEFWLEDAGGALRSPKSAMLNVWDDGYFTDDPVADGAFDDDVNN